MNENIKQTLDELYDSVARQLQLINQLRSQLNNTESVSINECVSGMQQPMPTVDNGSGFSSENQTQTALRNIMATRFATRSYPINGMQAFKNPSEDSTDKFFKLIIYNDNTFYFDLCNINVESLQTIKDNNLLPEEVASISGYITIDSTLKVNSPGKGRVEGRLYYIEHPMVVSVINNAK